MKLSTPPGSDRTPKRVTAFTGTTLVIDAARRRDGLDAVDKSCQRQHLGTRLRAYPGGPAASKRSAFYLWWSPPGLGSRLVAGSASLKTRRRVLAELVWRAISSMCLVQ